MQRDEVAVVLFGRIERFVRFELRYDRRRKAMRGGKTRDLGLGRCANFLNGELWGRPTHAWWGVIFPDAPRVPILDVPGLWMNVPRYPSQLIEAVLEGLVLQLILIAVRFGTKREGAVALTFMAGYAILRIVGEQFREPDADIGFWFGAITQGQLLSALMLLLTAVLAYLQFFTRRAPDSRVDSASASTGGKP